MAITEYRFTYTDKAVKSLWKVDDKEWMKQRREDWIILEQNAWPKASKRELAEKKRFFLKGEKKTYINELSLYLMTPFSAPDEARLVFYSDLFRHPSAKMNVLGQFVFIGSKLGRGLPWIQRSMQVFCVGVLGSEYKTPHCVDFNNEEIYPDDSDVLCRIYTLAAEEVFSGDYDYHGVMECFDYFLSAFSADFIPARMRPGKMSRIRKGINDMLSAAEKYIGHDDGSLEKRKFAEKILFNKNELERLLNAKLAAHPE
ncbi:MAG: hypothetical protein KBT87_14655 [Gammaproteobacteria bacterium]|nr:hypothetical protein [Gammaproteobacteria bacterium]